MGRKIKHPFTFSLALIILLFYSSCCSTTEPPDPPLPPPVVEEPVLTLELDDAHCTEAWLQLTTKDLELPAELTLKQYNPSGDSVTQTFSLSTQDSLLYIDSLLPNQTYNFQLSGIWNPEADSERTAKSNMLTVTTMDTTSHNFTFEMITFGGDIGSSVLYDVAIIDENNIWAVGEIWAKDDTSSLGYTKYNAVHWDGEKWELKAIYYGGYVVAITSVWSFSENDIWFGIGYLIHWNGLEFREVTIPNWNTRINGIWGRTSDDLYIVGGEGNIAHYNGSSWAKIESGTTLNINDIWGDYNEKTQEWEVLAVASNYGTGWEKEILKIQSNSVEKLSYESYPEMEPLLTVWFKTNRQYYVAGAGIYQKRTLTEVLWKNNNFDITEFATTSIKGANINDVFGVGAFGDFLHYNGLSWKSDYQEPLLSSGSYGSVKIKDNLIIATGRKNDEAVILIGRR